MTHSHSSRSAPTLPLSILFVFAYFLIGLVFLYQGHPYEDAYIIFKYIENLAKGYGWVYYAGGPQAEGYVDFLWVILNAIMVKLGFDVALAALTLNAFGFGIISFLFMTSVDEAKNPLGFKLWKYCFPTLLLFSPPVLASYGGFSTVFYCAFILMLFVSTLHEQYSLIPWLGLIVAFIRVDGVIIAISFYLLNLCTLPLAKKKIFVQGLIWVVLIGVSYFLWRWKKYGLMLPLPLYVKNSGLHLSGLVSNREWLFHRYAGAIYPLIALSSLSAFIFHKCSASVNKLFLSFLPMLFFIGILSFAAQWQNIHFRFQAPATLILYFMIYLLALEGIRVTRSKQFRLLISILVFVGIGPHLVYGAGVIKNMFRYQPSYLDTFAPLLANRLNKNHTFALTEAGRLAYWSHSKIEDMHGLNSPYTARFPPSEKYLQTLHPDMIQLQHAGVLNTSYWTDHREPYLMITAENLKMAYQGNPQLWEKDFEDYDKMEGDRSLWVPSLLIKYLFNHAYEYDFFLTFYSSWHRPKDYWHLYAIKKNLPQKDEILLDLEKIQKGYYRSYAQLKHFKLSKGINHG